MAEDKRFPVPAAVRPAVMAAPPKQSGKWQSKLWASMCTALEHARGWRSSRFEKTKKGMHILLNLLVTQQALFD